MKKLSFIMIFLISMLGLYSCKSIEQLSAPVIREVLDNTVYWNEVSGANSYTIKINDYQEKCGNVLKYSISSLIDDKIEENITVKLHIYVKAEGNQKLYLDSDWSAEYTMDYIKMIDNNAEMVGYGKIYEDIGIGRPVNLIDGSNDINASVFSPASGAEYSIFDKNKLYNQIIVKSKINIGEIEQSYGSDYDEFSNSWRIDVSKKISKTSLNIDGFPLPGQTDMNIEIDTGYERKRKEETTELYYKLHQNITGYKIELMGYNNIDRFSNILSKNFIEDAIKVRNNELSIDRFISMYGTHVMTAAYYGAAIEADYYYIENKTNLDQNWHANAVFNLKKYLMFSDVTSNTKLDYEQFLTENSNHKYSQFKSKAIGGRPSLLTGVSLESFADSRAKWAESVNEDNYVLTDVPAHSLYFCWDYLDDSFNDVKQRLQEYFNMKTSSMIDLIREKINDFYNENYEGTESHPIYISSVNDFNLIRNNMQEKKYFKLKNDIIFNSNFNPIDEFHGTLDGNGFKLINLSIFEQKMKKGLLDNSLGSGFVRNNFGTIKNIEISKLNLNIDTLIQDAGDLTLYVGFVGYNAPDGIIENVIINDSSNLNSDVKSMDKNTSLRLLFGSICGVNCGLIQKITFMNSSICGNLVGSKVEVCVAGIVGDNWDCGDSRGILKHALVLKNSIEGNSTRIFGPVAITNVGGVVAVTSGLNFNLVSLKNNFEYNSNDENWCGQIIGREYSGEASDCLCSIENANCWIIGDKNYSGEFGEKNFESVLIRILENWDLTIWNVNIEEQTISIYK